jgi:DNA-binding transcriptional regulator GbsR (MarR family)
MTKHTPPALTEEEAVNLTRNALLVAGHELGENGDHWPVVKDTIYQIARDWEELKIERAVDAEMKIHLYAELDAAEKKLKDLDPAIRTRVAPKLRELREIYDAYFETAYVDELVLEDIPTPAHLQRAEAILETLEEENV